MAFISLLCGVALGIAIGATFRPATARTITWLPIHHTKGLHVATAWRKSRRS